MAPVSISALMVRPVGTTPLAPRCSPASRRPVAHAPRRVVARATETEEDSGLADFAAVSIDAYKTVDQSYKDRPVQQRKYSPAGDIMASFVDPDDHLVDYKYANYAGDKKDIILLQGFHWESWKCDGGWYNMLQNVVQEIKEAGITHVWLPPPSQSVAAQGYLPSVLYNMDTKYGSYKDLRAILKAFNDADVVPMADIVINHRCAQSQDEQGRWNNFEDEYQKKYGLGGYGADHARGVDWDRWAITGDDPVFGGTGNPDSGADFDAAPDLDHHNSELRQALKDWLNWLHKDMGYGGWRLDFVKGYAANYAGEYIKDTIGEKAFHVGELWTDMNWEGEGLGANQDGARQALCDWIDGAEKTSAAFDFPTKGILQYAVAHCEYWRLAADGKPTGLLGWWPSMAVTFVDNHDTGGVQNHWPFPSYHVALGYAYCFTHPGNPCIFWPHLFDNKDLKKTILELIAIRKRNGIKADSPIEIKCAEHDMYLATINGNVTIKMGPRGDMGDLVPSESDGWKMAQYGRDYAVWEKK
eukprot:CAMPEP_0177777322 /NCGR_PEP_ID=MMETSP0491_2-20121128/15281_1 /TAXON_ID=63592 /ORGANISM="Tetraselmis chuii, Strain PLY429" /LENGTH=526 /DNA_ID=CAMNT_0019296365 /DNA_START=129 /DNA_END=1709 /DNA_ORIENTATION=-